MTDILSTVDTTVVSVTTQQLNRKSDGRPFTKWVVLTSDGTEWQTFDANLGNRALALQGYQALLQVKIWKSGDFTNYDLTAIRPSASTPAGLAAPTNPQAVPVLEAANQAMQAQGKAPEVSYTDYKDLAAGQEERKNISIHRQVAAKVAAWLNTEDEEFWMNVNDLFTYFQTGVYPGMPLQEQPERGVTSHAGDEPPREFLDDDIPF
jgi:hypothetical protein